MFYILKLIKSYCFRYKDWYLGTATQNINLEESNTFICDMF